MARFSLLQPDVANCDLFHSYSSGLCQPTILYPGVQFWLFTYSRGWFKTSETCTGQDLPYRERNTPKLSWLGLTNSLRSPVSSRSDNQRNFVWDLWRVFYGAQKNDCERIHQICSEWSLCCSHWHAASKIHWKEQLEDLRENSKSFSAHQPTLHIWWKGKEGRCTQQKVFWPDMVLLPKSSVTLR